jgi:hypothetical protein
MGVVGGGLLEVSGSDGEVDGIQETSTNSRVWTARSIASSRGGEERLERLWAAVCFGRGWAWRLAAK